MACIFTALPELLKPLSEHERLHSCSFDNDPFPKGNFGVVLSKNRKRRRRHQRALKRDNTRDQEVNQAVRRSDSRSRF
jgi:hypothetical protein